MSDYITRERNLTLLTDYYEYTMVNGYFHAGIQEKIAVFDVFSAVCRKTVALPSMPACSRLSNLLMAFLLLRRTSSTSVKGLLLGEILQFSAEFQVPLRCLEH